MQAVEAEGPIDRAASATFEDFFEAEGDRLFRALCLVTKNRHEAEEVAQEAFLKLWERWDRRGAIDDATAYLYRTAMNIFRNRYRRAKLGVRKAIGFAPRDDGLDAVEDRDVIRRSLASLSDKQRAALVLTDLLGFGAEEAGGVMGLNAGAIRTLASRARADLRQMAGDRDE